MKRTVLRSFALITALILSAFSTALAGPPWIAIEYPANPLTALPVMLSSRSGPTIMAT